MNPARISSEMSPSLSRPQSVAMFPISDIRVKFSHIFGKTIEVHFPLKRIFLSLDILLENRTPFRTSNVVIKEFVSLAKVGTREIEFLSSFNI